MPSPFPGMDPFIEDGGELIHDFHQTSIPIIRELLDRQLPAPYEARLETALYIHELPASERRLVGRTDVAVAELPEPGLRGGGIATTLAREAAPTYGVLPMVAVDELRLNYLEIRDRQGERLVTVIEMLSRSNKYAGGDREKYLQKRYELLKTDAHLVEIDLLRGGPRLPLDGMPECDYCALVSRAEDRPKVGIWPIMLRERLPVVPIPLREPHQDVALDLQEMLSLVYDRSGYARRIYRGTPQPALSAADAEWAAGLVPREAM